jgi:hypothetical protein
MKTSIKVFLAVATLTTFSATAQTTQKGAATVETYEGFYIYILSKPAVNFTVLGTVKKGLAFTGQPDEMLKGQTKEARKKYPTADGLIFNLSLDRGEVIKFE